MEICQIKNWSSISLRRSTSLEAVQYSQIFLKTSLGCHLVLILVTSYATCIKTDCLCLERMSLKCCYKDTKLWILIRPYNSIGLFPLTDYKSLFYQKLKVILASKTSERYKLEDKNNATLGFQAKFFSSKFESKFFSLEIVCVMYLHPLVRYGSKIPEIGDIMGLWSLSWSKSKFVNPEYGLNFRLRFCHRNFNLNSFSLKTVCFTYTNHVVWYMSKIPVIIDFAGLQSWRWSKW